MFLNALRAAASPWFVVPVIAIATVGYGAYLNYQIDRKNAEIVLLNSANSALQQTVTQLAVQNQRNAEALANRDKVIEVAQQKLNNVRKKINAQNDKGIIAPSIRDAIDGVRSAASNKDDVR